MSENHNFEKVEIFKNYLDILKEDGRLLAEGLYESWEHLGVGKEKSLERIRKLNDIIKGFFEEIKEETDCQVMSLKEDIKALEDEAVTLGKYLSLNIDVTECGLNRPMYIRKTLLENELEMYRHEVSTRKKQIKLLKDWQDDLCRSLGERPNNIREEPLLSVDEVSKLKARLELLQKKKDKRFETFTFQKQDIRDLMAALNLAPSNEFERKLLTGDPAQFVLNDENLARIIKMHETMSFKLREMKNMVMELREYLNTLWERLEEDPVYKGNFLDANPGHGIETINALREEIARCEEKKRQNLKMFTAKLRTDIARMWEECLFGEKDKEAFEDFYANSFTESLLDRHEEYYQSLQNFYNENNDIFKLYDERRTLFRKMQEMEASSAPSRLTNRGGALLKEEKYRKAIAFKLPKLEKLLIDQLTNYELRTGKTFNVNDEPLLIIMKREWDDRNKERQLKQSARKQREGLTPTGLMSDHLKISPLGKRNQTSKITPVPAKKQAFTTMSASRAQIAADNSNLIKRSAVTSARRIISPRQASRTEGLIRTNAAPRRRLRLSDKRRSIDHKQNTSKSDNKSAAVFKAPPIITVNGNTLKQKRRLSGKAKSTRRKSMRSQNSKSSDLAPTSEESDTSLLKEIKSEKVVAQDSTIMTSYSEFQEHLHDNVGCRSSIVPERVLRIRKDHPNLPDEMPIVESPKKSKMISPMKPARTITPRKGKENALLDSAVTPKSRLHLTNVFGVTPTSNIQRITRSNTQIITKPTNPNAMNIDTLATPRIKQEGMNKNSSFLPLRRQNTVTLFSPMQHDTKLLRSNSSHNLMYNKPDIRKIAVSPSAVKNPPKLKLAKPLPLII